MVWREGEELGYPAWGKTTKRKRRKNNKTETKTKQKQLER
jgi:hypothetical protein